MKKSVRLFFILSLLFIVLSSSFILAGQLKVTEEHPFLVNGKWISASELQIGDELTTIDGQKIVIKNLRFVYSDEVFSVYNLEAEDIHNFVVTEDNLVVHNSNALNSNSGPCKGDYANCPFLRYQGGSLASGTSRSELFRGIDPKIDQLRASAWIDSSLTPEVRAARVKFVKNIKMISLADEETQLIRSILDPIDGLNEILYDGKPYVVLLGRDMSKSNAWVYKLAKPYLSRKPVLETYISDKVVRNPSSLLNKAYEAGVRRFVIFDDVSYSGTELAAEFAKRLNTLKIKPQDTIEIIFDVPYMTSSSKSYIIAEFKGNPQIRVKFTPYKKVETMEEIFTTGELELLGSPLGLASSRGATYTEWRIPDESSIDRLVYGLLVKDRGEYNQLIPYKQKGTLYYLEELRAYNAYCAQEKIFTE